MRRDLFTVVLLVGPLAGCSILAGVDQFQKGDCTGGDCSDAQSGADGGGKMDGTIESAPDGTMSGDGAMDTGANDGGGPPDDATMFDVYPDGCGPINTVQNCTMCGATCDTINSNGASCNGSTCLYQSCQMGWSNCSTTAPDLAGCECNTPSCCGSSCQTTHQNGLGKDFYDCVAQGTFNLVQAIEACTAYTGNQNACSTTTCVQPKDNLVCGSLNNKCACWDYSGQTPGHVLLSANSQCYCPGANDPSWN